MPVLCHAQSRGNNRTFRKTNSFKWVPGCEVTNIWCNAKRVTRFSSIPVWYEKLIWNTLSWPQSGEPPHWNRLQGLNVFKIIWDVLVKQQLCSCVRTLQFHSEHILAEFCHSHPLWIVLNHTDTFWAQFHCQLEKQLQSTNTNNTYCGFFQFRCGKITGMDTPSEKR